MDQIVKKNKAVSVTYSILDQDGEVLEQSDIPVEALASRTRR